MIAFCARLEFFVQNYCIVVWSQWCDDYLFVHLISDLPRQMHQHKPCKLYQDTVCDMFLSIDIVC